MDPNDTPQLSPLNPQEVPDFLRLDEWFQEDVTPYELDMTEPYSPPRFTLSWKGVPFAPLGGIHNVTGQAGNGKTMLIAQFIAAILKGEYGNLRYELSDAIPHPRVLYIDTEMEKDSTIAMKNRVLTLADREIGKDYDDLKVIMLREVTEEKQTEKDRHGVTQTIIVPAAVIRWRMVLKAIWQYRPTVAFIDGLIDVVSDFNDNVACQEIIYKCMQIATHYDISLWCVLHQNPGGEKLVGHLGSFIERKVTDVIQVKKNKDDQNGEVTFETKQKKARSRDIEDWNFRVLATDAWGRPEQIEKNAEAFTKYRPEEVKRWLIMYQSEVEWPATKKEIGEIIFKDRVGIKHGADIQTCIEISTNRTFLIPQSREDYSPGQKHPKYVLNPEVMPVE